MGLDMYLKARQYFSSSMDDDHPIKTLLKEHSNGFALNYISWEVGYWRKANAIHNWFVKNIQDGKDDCGCYFVTTEHLFKLKDVCFQVLSDNSLAQELLPTTSGFFFGGTHYDMFYFRYLDDTIKIIDKILPLKGFAYFYSASW